MLFGVPEPLQPSDAPQDRILRFTVDTRYLDTLTDVEFECATCHERYMRKVVRREAYELVVEVEGVGTYPLNPRLIAEYEVNPHVCEIITTIGVTQERPCHERP